MPSIAITDDLDPRLTPARDDLAASWLKDHVKAARYVEPSREQIKTAIASVYRQPENGQSIETQLLFGEHVDVYEKKDGWAWVQSVTDGYVGYIRDELIGTSKGDTTATHRVANIGSFAFPASDNMVAMSKPGAFVTPGTGYKNTPEMILSYGSKVRVVNEKEVLCELSNGLLVPTAHLAAVDFFAEDPIAEAFRFLGVPYLWGGRSNSGVDCSSLIQLVMQACNIICARDCEFQERHLGKEIPRDEARAGDIVIFRSNHIGLLVDENTIIHASDRNLAVTIDDMDEYASWRAKMGKASGKNQIKMFKRI